MKLVGVLGVGMALLVAVGCSAESNDEAPITVRQSKLVGDPVREVILPEPVFSACPADDVPLGTGPAHVAISVAAVPAGSLGTLTDSPPLPADKILLATSCRTQQANGGNVVYFIDPGPPTLATVPEVITGTLVHRITTTVSTGTFPFFGWGALAFRGDISPQDLLACANPATGGEPHKIYSISLATGVASELFDGIADAAFPFPCDGLAWDPGNDTIWMSTDLSPFIYHFANPTPPTPGVPGVQITGSPIDISATGCPNSGIEVVGPNLLLGCNGSTQLLQVDRNGDVNGMFTSGALRTEDLECDRSTFAAAATPVSVMWSKDAFVPHFLSFEVPLASCGICRPAERRDLNTDLDDAQRTQLAALTQEYLTSGNATGVTRGTVVAEHRVAINSWHGQPQFFPGHRGFIGEFELWLQDRGHTQFVPLPKWDPGKPVPAQFGGSTGVGGTDIDACSSSWLLNAPVTAGATACTTAPCTRSFTNAVCAGSPTSGSLAPLPPEFVWDFPGGPICSGFTNIEAIRNALEGPWHGGAVHCGVFQGSSTMCDVRVSPSSLIFIFWHAFVDDVSYNWECKCNNSCSVCTDVFTPFNAGPSTLPYGERYSRRHGHRPPAAMPNIGYWWWFEDDVIPPDLSPPATMDHSPFRARASVRGRAKLTPGMVGQALSLDGRDDAVVADDRRVGDIGVQNFTVDAWIKTSASGVQPIVSKIGDDDDHGGRSGRDEGYALFLNDGQLALFIGTNRKHAIFETTDLSLADGNWHHVAAVVDRDYATRSRLMVDGVVALQFDATPYDDDATTRARLRIGDMEVAKSNHVKKHCRHHRDQFARFKGEIDELAMVRSALPLDQVASIFVAGSAGRFGSLGNLPTSAGQPPCIDQLGQRIAALSPADAAPLNVLYAQLQAAIAAGNIGQARARARQISAQAEAGFDGSYLTVGFHAVAHTADGCLTVPPLGRSR